ncbi:hypothetical protein POJ06DRAFT_95179 [Lipomyces tetrasporus]|uniref:EGF-like domain-containing protein n=1 Tax=Lipomyces tetrasporus TaxID=54092 RepID=A0AAD7QTR7_9ASCO|nr:uncharacterized protein POJ06DRAFT_95179 [Lipomyces tetrasporus]KAJ8101352.1 hypothetical protein POJ06DRAFT_95179 [Lipomyces tetrasporus]
MASSPTSSADMPSNLVSATSRFAHSDRPPPVSPSHYDSTDSEFSVDDDVDTGTDIDESQAEIVSITQHGSVSQMLRGAGRARQRMMPSLSTQVEKANDQLSPIVESSSPISATPQDDRMLADVLARSKRNEKEVSPSTGGSSSVRDARLSIDAPFARTGKPGIVRKTKPPPLDIERTKGMDRLSIVSIGDLVKRATSSIRGTTTAPHVLPNRAAEELKVSRSINADMHVSEGMTAARQSRTPVSPNGYDQQPAVTPRNRNRVFGLPWWIFTLIVIGSIITIVVAVVVPIQVTSNRRSSSPQSAQSSSLSPTPSATTTLMGLLAATSAAGTPSATAAPLTASECESALTCENNGVSVVKDNTCACVCVGDFGGTLCDTVSNNACTIVAIPGSASSRNVTLGTSIAPLVSNETAQQFSSVSLDVRTIYRVFNSTGVSCASQNALVTFNGRSRRRDVARSYAEEYGDYKLYIRASGDDDGGASFNVTDIVLKFARIVVLDVAQTNKTVNDAVTIQQNLQEAFSNDLIDPETGVVDAGNGVLVNFMEFTVDGISGGGQ